MYKIFIWCNLILFGLASCSHQPTALKVDLVLQDSIKTLAPMVSAKVVKVGADHYLYTGGEGKALESSKVNSDGHFSQSSALTINSKFGGLRGIINTQIGKKQVLIVGNKANNALEVYQINPNGALQLLSSVDDTDTTFLKLNITTALIKIDDKQFVFVGGLDPGLSCYQLSNTGTLQHIQSMPDDSTLFLDGIIGMTSLLIDGNTYLFTGGFIDDGMSSFLVNSDGTFTNVDNVKDDENLFLNGAYPLNAVQLANKNYVIIGHRHKVHYSAYAKENQANYHGDGINVFEINSKGKITLSSLFKDTEQLKLSGSTRIELIKISEKQALVFIATRDDEGIQIASLTPDGVLTPLGAYNLNYSVYNGMTLKQIDNRWFLFAGGYGKRMLKSYLININ